MAAPTASFRMNGSVTIEEIEQRFLDRSLENARECGGVGSQLRRVARGLRVEVAVDAVGLEIEDDQPLRLVPEAVHHALQQHLFPGCRGS